MRKKDFWWSKYTNNDIEYSLTLTPSVEYWFNKLSEYCLSMFDWTGLPESIPQREIEKVLMLYSGTGAVVKASFTSTTISGSYWFVQGSESGVTPYPDYFKNFTYGRAGLLSHTYKQNTKSCIVVWNNSMKTSLFDFILRYAILLSNTEITSNVNLINARMTDSFIAPSRVIADSLKKYKEAVREGKTEVILTDELNNLIARPDNVPSQLVSERQHLSHDSLESWELRNEILRSFFQSIGRRFAKEKKERMSVDEVLLDDDSLLINVDDMEYCRKDFCHRVNNILGWNMDVKYSGKIMMEDEVNEKMDDSRDGSAGEGTEHTITGEDNA